MHEVVERLQFLKCGWTELHFAPPFGCDFIGRRRPAHSAGDADWVKAARRTLRAGQPSIGLHHRDNGRLLTALENLRDLGNTVLVVEHDRRNTIRRADYVIDLGPGADVMGGSLVAHGTPEEIMRDPNSLTGAYHLRQSANRDACRAAPEEWGGADHSRREGK